MKKISLFFKSFVFVFFTYPLNTLLIVLLSVCEGLIPASLALIMKNLVDTILVSSNIDLQRFAILVILWLCIMIAAQAVSTVLRVVIDVYKLKLANNISEQIIQKRLSFFGIALFEDEAFLKVYNRLQNTHIAIENFINNFRFVCKSGVEFISLFIIFTQFEFWVPLVIFVSIIPGIFTARKISAMQVEQDDLYYDNERIISYYRNALISPNNAREIHIFDFGNLFFTKFKNYSQNFFKQNKKYRTKIALYDFIAVIARICGAGILMFVLSKDAAAGKISAGLFAMFMQSVFSFSTAMLEIIEFWSYLDSALEYFKKLFDFFTMPDTLRIAEKPKSINGTIHSIEFRNVSFGYSADKKVLDNISFKIHAGEITALVGENGAGKSTLIKLLARFYDPSSGDIFINEVNLKDLDLLEYRKKLSAVFQDYVKYNVSARENIFACEHSVQKPTDKVDLNFCSELEKGFDTELGTYLGGVELSGGQWQRIAIARGLAKPHEIFLVDEPTAAIDPIQERTIYESLLQGHETVLLVTHRLGSVRRADRILVLQNGMLLASGSHSDLMAQCPYYNRLYSSQADMYRE